MYVYVYVYVYIYIRMACLRPLLAFGICENLQKQTATVDQNSKQHLEFDIKTS